MYLSAVKVPINLMNFLHKLKIRYLPMHGQFGIKPCEQNAEYNFWNVLQKDLVTQSERADTLNRQVGEMYR